MKAGAQVSSWKLGAGQESTQAGGQAAGFRASGGDGGLSVTKHHGFTEDPKSTCSMEHVSDTVLSKLRFWDKRGSYHASLTRNFLDTWCHAARLHFVDIMLAYQLLLQLEHATPDICTCTGPAAFCELTTQLGKAKSQSFKRVWKQTTFPMPGHDDMAKEPRVECGEPACVPADPHSQKCHDVLPQGLP
eukprot:365743-Chlamydomonas_euryale.AAC.19